MEYQTLVKERRSALNFQEGVAISQSELEAIFEESKNYPSCFNLQHAHYYVTTDPSIKSRLKDVSWGQHKVVTASAAIILCGDLKAYQQAPDLFMGMKMLGIMDQLEYDTTISTINALYEGGGAAFAHEEAVRNASLSAMLFMLAAKDQGWDTCPMIGFDAKAVSSLLQIPNEQVPVLMITLGKSVVDKARPRGYRKPVSEFVHFV